MAVKKTFWEKVKAFFDVDWYSGDLLNPYESPKPVIMSKEAARFLGCDVDAKGGKGYYTIRNGLRVPVIFK